MQLLRFISFIPKIVKEETVRTKPNRTESNRIESNEASKEQEPFYWHQRMKNRAWNANYRLKENERVRERGLY